MAEKTKMSLLQFLKENRVDSIRKEVELPRLKGYTFVIRPISVKEYNDIEQSAVKVRGNSTSVSTDIITERVITTGLVEPDFANDEFLTSLGASSVWDAINKVLLVGEVAQLRTQIMELSGLTDTVEDLVTEAKNE